MYRDSDLQSCFFGLVGFRQTENPDYPQLTPSLLVSSTGLYFQQEHPLINIENLDQAFKNYDKFNYPAYSALTAYAEGDKVRAANSKVYESLQDANLGNEPSANPGEWAEVNHLSQKVESIVKGSISRAISSMFTKKKLDQVTKSIFENVQLYDGAGQMTDKEIKAGRFVGFQIAVENYRDIVTVVKRLGTQFTAANPNFKLYVFHSSQEEPIKIYTMNLTRVNSFQWTTITDGDGELYLKYLADGYAPGGVFYIGYYEDELVGQAINRGYDFGSAPTCGTCNQSYAFYTKWSRYLSVMPFAVPASRLVGILPIDNGGIPKLWDIVYNQYTGTRNYGLNMDLTTRCDVTEFFCRERFLFADVILKQVTVDLLQEIAYGTRNNVIAKETRDLAIYALNNKDNNTPGVVKRLEDAIKAISFDMSNLNETCLPCDDGRAGGLSWGTI